MGRSSIQSRACHLQKLQRRDLRKESLLSNFKQLFFKARKRPSAPDHAPTADPADATGDSCQHEQNMGSTRKTTGLEAASLKACKKRQVWQPEIPQLPGKLHEEKGTRSLHPKDPPPDGGLLPTLLRCARIYPCSCKVPLGYRDQCLRTSLKLSVPNRLQDSFMGFPKSCPCSFTLWVGLRWESGGTAALSCHVPAEGTRTLLLHQNPGDDLLLSGSEWLRAQTGREGSLRYKWSTWKTSSPTLDLSLVISLTIRKWDKKPALWGAKPAGVPLRMQHRVPKIILFHP